MKKLLCMVMVSVMCVSLAGCKTSSQSKDNTSSEPTSSAPASSTPSAVPSSTPPKNSKSEEDRKSDWELGNYVDEFGDKTFENYAGYKGVGTFSNSATTNSELTYKILVDDKNVAIILYEYGYNKVKSSRISNKKYTISTKDHFRETSQFYGYIPSGSDRILLDGDAREYFIEQMQMSDVELKCHIVENDSPTTCYDFVVASYGFKNIYEQIDRIY